MGKNRRRGNRGNNNNNNNGNNGNNGTNGNGSASAKGATVASKGNSGGGARKGAAPTSVNADVKPVSPAPSPVTYSEPAAAAAPARTPKKKAPAVVAAASAGKRSRPGTPGTPSTPGTPPMPVVDFSDPMAVFDRYGFLIQGNDGALYLERLNKTRGVETEKEKQRKRKLHRARLQQSEFNVKKELLEVVKIGLPVEERFDMWMALSGGDSMEAGMYDHMLRVTPTAPADIEYEKKVVAQVHHDIRECFSLHPRFLEPEVVAALKRVMLAYVRKNNHTGYTQSLMFIAGYLLLFSGVEEEVFIMLWSVTHNYLSGYFTDNMLGSQVDAKVFKTLLREEMPTLAAHLEKIHVNTSLVCIPWFKTVFSTALPCETLSRVWDCFFYEGAIAMFRVGLGLLKSLESELLAIHDVASGKDRIEAFCRTMYDSDKLIKLCHTEFAKLTPNHLTQLRSAALRNTQQENQEIHRRGAVNDLAAATHFGMHELEDLSVSFQEVCSDEGTVDFKTFCSVMGDVIPRLKDDNKMLMQLFNAFDKDGDRAIEFRELSCGLSSLCKGSTEERLKLCFQAFDADRSGAIEPEELAAMIRTMYNTFLEDHDQTDEEIDAVVKDLFNNLDTDGDGELTFEEFKQVSIVEPRLVSCFVDGSADKAQNKGMIGMANLESSRSVADLFGGGSKVAGGSDVPRRMDGWITKAFGVLPRWKRRFFVLNPNELQYYADEKCVNLVRTIPLTPTTYVTRTGGFDKPNPFELATASRTYLLSVESEGDKNRWIDAIQHNINLLNRGGAAF